MKIRMTVTVDVDVDEWVAEYGVDRDRIREDVREYIKTGIQSAPAGIRGVTVK